MGVKQSKSAPISTNNTAVTEKNTFDAFQSLNDVHWLANNAILAAHKLERLQLNVPMIRVADQATLTQQLDAKPTYALMAAAQKSAPSLQPDEGSAAAETSYANLTQYYKLYGAAIGEAVPDKDRLAAFMDRENTELWGQWVKFKHLYARKNRGDVNDEKCFQSFLNEEYTGRQSKLLMTLFRQEKHLPIHAAVSEYDRFAAQDHVYTDFYTTKLEDVTAFPVQIRKLQFESTNKDTDTSHTWAGGGAKVRYDFFSVDGTYKYNELHEKIINSEIHVEIELHVLTDLRADHSKGGWFSLAFLTKTRDHPTAFETKEIYDNHYLHDEHSHQYGDLVYFLQSLIFVNRVRCTVTVLKEFTDADEQKLEVRAKAGFWPFFLADSQGGHNKVKRSDDKTKLIMTVDTHPGLEAGKHVPDADKEGVWVMGRKLGYVFEI